MTYSKRTTAAAAWLLRDLDLGTPREAVARAVVALADRMTTDQTGVDLSADNTDHSKAGHEKWMRATAAQRVARFALLELGPDELRSILREIVAEPLATAAD